MFKQSIMITIATIAVLIAANPAKAATRTTIANHLDNHTKYYQLILSGYSDQELEKLSTDLCPNVYQLFSNYESDAAAEILAIMIAKSVGGYNLSDQEQAAAFEIMQALAMSCFY
jgi:hypothetical protein